MKPPFYHRHVIPRLQEALTDSPVVLIHGPRQCGKTTLARSMAETGEYHYQSFDDEVLRASVEADPMGFVADLPSRAILDEVQRVPGIFTALKESVDRDRTAGRFILTGSANVLLVPRLSDSLAGRMEILRLHPLAQDELARAPSDFLDRLFEGRFAPRRTARLGRDLISRIVAGGYPAALAREGERRRAIWYRDYVETLVQRDVRDLARITSLDAVPRLLAVASGQTARLLNTSDLAAAFHLSRPTIREYTTLLARVFLLEELPPWYSNRLKRLTRTPKLHLGDTGVACALLGLGATSLAEDRETLGQLLETFVFQELRRQASRHEEPFAFHHYRDKDGAEVDVVLESSGRIAGVEVKLAGTVTLRDFRGLERLREGAGKRFAGGVVLYDGEVTTTFGDRLTAVPIRRLWESASLPG